MSPVDLVLIEGYKHHAHEKIEVHRPALGKPVIAPTEPTIIAIACDSPPADMGDLEIDLLDLNDPAAIARYILSSCGLAIGQRAPVETAG